MREYTQKLMRHRMNIVGRVLIGAIVLVVSVLILKVYYSNRTFDGYDTLSSVEHTDSLYTRYAEYGEYLIRYSKDGVSCVDLEHELIWSQTFNMQDPLLEVCKTAGAIADRGGNQLYLFGETGLTGQVTTLLPIQQMTISRQGVTAVLLEDSDVSWIYLYDKKGDLLLDARCNLAETGQPISMSLAPDGSKLAVSYLQIAGGTSNSCVVFYNLGAVGANFLDKIVASRVYEDTLVPRVKYLDENTCVAIGESGFYVYEGAEIPEQTKEVTLEAQIQSVLFGEKEFALVYEQEGEIPFLLRVFDEKGDMVAEQPFDLLYSQILLSEREIIVYNDSECLVYSKNGVLRYQGTFEESIRNFYGLKGNRYVVVHPKKTEQIKLR